MTTTLAIESVTETRTGRISVKFTKDGKAQRKIFRSRQLLIVWAKGLAALGAYWGGSCSSSVVADIEAGRFTTLYTS